MVLGDMGEVVNVIRVERQHAVDLLYASGSDSLSNPYAVSSLDAAVIQNFNVWHFSTPVRGNGPLLGLLALVGYVWPIRFCWCDVALYDIVVLRKLDAHFRPMLGHGDLLRTFDICVPELLDRSENSRPFTFQPKAGEVVSPCTSLFIALEESLSSDPNVVVLRPITPVNGTYLDLDHPISLFHDALDLRPIGHPDRPTTQLHLAIALLFRFAKRGFQTDADAAEELLYDVLDVCHAKSHIHRLALLAVKTHAEKMARTTDANDVQAERPTASMFPLSSDQLADRVEWCQQIDDPHALDDVISLHYEALNHYGAGHAQQGPLLCHLSCALQLRFGRRGFGHDLNGAISFQREALAIFQVGHPGRPVSLANLANALLTRFQHQGINEDLDDSIKLHMQALDLRAVGHLSRPTSLSNLAHALSTRFEHRGNDKDLNDAIALNRQALDLWPADHPSRSFTLNYLGMTLATCFKHRGSDRDLEEAIRVHREALDLRPVGHPERAMTLKNLAEALSERRDNDNDLDEAIVLGRESLNLLQVGHPGRSASLNCLANAFSTRFKHQGNDKDLDEAITLYSGAHDLLPVGHPDRCASLNNLASVLLPRFEHRCNDQDLDEAIALCREALVLRSGGHPDRFKSLNNLGSALSTCFSHRGNDELLEEAIALYREALDLQPVGHPDQSGSSNNLANALLTRFEHRGNDKDLDDAITIWREELYSLPAGHHDRSRSLNDLATALITRFKHRGNVKDLDEAMELHRETLYLRPDNHLDQSTSLINHADVLAIQFEHQGNDELLDEAVTLSREVLNLQSVGHPHRIVSLNNLANMPEARFKHSDNHQDLDEAVALYKKALDLRSDGHVDRLELLVNLANVLSVQFTHQGNIHHLDEALENACSALSLLRTHDPRRSTVHRSLATIHMLFYESRLHSTGEDVDSLNAAMGHSKAGVDSFSSGLRCRLQTSLLWIRNAEKYTHSTLLEAYATSIQLLDDYISATASLSSRHDMMRLFPHTLAVGAASCALRHGEMARFRVPIEGFQERSDHADALVKKFRELSYLLNKPPAKLQEGTPRLIVDAEAVRYTDLVDEWKKTVEEIRKLEGFSRFMLPPLFSDLQDAARDGPVIVLIASESSRYAIIIPRHHSPINMQLATSVKKLERWVNTLQRIVRRKAGPEEAQTKLVETLRELWDDVVCPVVEHLGRFAPPGSRIWWCPTSAFNFLPLHAAGEYRRGGKNLSQLYISSYTPSLTALIRARERHDRSQPMPFAAIGQNHPPGYPFSLRSVEPELKLVRSLLPPAPTVSFTKLTSVESTKSRALGTLRDNHWLHFACHGIQNLAEPFKSAFLMRDEPLTLLDITQMNLSRHEFAFLSACETAVGNFETPDEVIHLAAALQFAGVKSVVGTFWRVQDSTVQRLVEAFYKNLCGDGKMNPKRAARALHMAVQSLAGDEDIPLDQRIVFMHVGI
ncbi:TPR-like protein [Rhizopogon salebrosus TDB-379]|nr:TPR-like protein [Rhizopogon salebrosus TDB-379]